MILRHNVCVAVVTAGADGASRARLPAEAGRHRRRDEAVSTLAALRAACRCVQACLRQAVTSSLDAGVDAIVDVQFKHYQATLSQLFASFRAKLFTGSLRG